jgi:hypothetical protein
MPHSNLTLHSQDRENDQAASGVTTPLAAATYHDQARRPVLLHATKLDFSDARRRSVTCAKSVWNLRNRPVTDWA